MCGIKSQSISVVFLLTHFHFFRLYPERDFCCLDSFLHCFYNGVDDVYSDTIDLSRNSVQG
jgi:hypothetical protein